MSIGAGVFNPRLGAADSNRRILDWLKTVPSYGLELPCYHQRGPFVILFNNP